MAPNEVISGHVCHNSNEMLTKSAIRSIAITLNFVPNNLFIIKGVVSGHYTRTRISHFTYKCIVWTGILSPGRSFKLEVTSICGKNMIIGVICRPNTFPLADIDILTTTLFGVLDIINSENKKSIITWDMNIDMLKDGYHDRIYGIFPSSQSAYLITPFWRKKLAQKMGTTLLQQLRNCDGNVA